MRLQDFDYPLDESLIAQQPIEPRDHARLLVVTRPTGALSHHRFDELPGLLRPGDLLILNDTQVIPARLLGRKVSTGGKIEVFLVRPLTPTLSPMAHCNGKSNGRPGRGRPLYPLSPGGRGQGEGECWQVLIKGSVRPGQQLELPDGVQATVMSSSAGGHLIEFPATLDVFAYAEKAGLVPLPPYIQRAPTEADRDRYQTVYARRPGAVAAPTAGLHFTDAVLRKLEAWGVRTASVTLHVGPGTFKPVKSEDIRDHKMDREWYELPERTAQAINETKNTGGRVIAVGTTAVRVLETMADQGVPLRAGAGETVLFIYPGFEFKVVDAMLTNFHLPKSTLFMLVCALAGRERMLEAYRAAAAERYRFYSYGDAMLIV
jgi:S-adenosylmethionine:tRNA ribosyltransferase-isomerase